MSDSASYDSSRRNGGRAGGFGKKFALWANEPAPESKQGVTLFGKPYWLEAGTPRFHTMCRSADKKLMKSAQLIESDNQFEIDVDVFNYKYEDRIFGLDGETGYQMLQFAIEEGIEAGYLQGSPYYDKDNPLRSTGKPHSVRVVPIGEPGLKVRTITVSEDWVTQFLSPFGHDLVSNLALIPAATAGLGASAQLYEWCKRAAYAEGIDDVEALEFLTSDLTQASEYLEHVVSKRLLKSFCDGAGLTGPYVDLAIVLLATPCFLEKCEGPITYEYMGRTTVRASPMGFPGTKGTLTLTMLVAEEAAFTEWASKRYGRDIASIRADPPRLPWRIFSTAGDDHLASGPREYLELIGIHLVKLGAMLNIDKCYISALGAYFTEEMLLRTRRNRLCLKRPIWEVPYEGTCHVDALKVRLLSRCSKVTLVQDEKNPALGKSRDFLRKLEWLNHPTAGPTGFQGFADFALARFRYRFNRLIDWGSALTYFPRNLGGLGFPLKRGLGHIELLDMYSLLPSAVQEAIALVVRGDANEYVKHALWLYSSNTTFRGMTMRTGAEDQLKAIFTQFVGDTITNEDALRALLEEKGVNVQRWSLLRQRDKQRLARSVGYVSLSEAIQQFERPTYFKEVLASLSGLLQEDVAHRTMMVWEENLDQICREDDLTYDQVREAFPSEYNSFVKSRNDWFARQAYIETWAFTLVPGHQGEGKIPAEPRVTRSFNSTPLVQRPAQMDRIIRRHLPTRLSLEERLTVMSNYLLEVGDSIPPAPSKDVVWIRSSRIVDLCTLSTPINYKFFG